MIQHTLSLLKPDTIKRGLVGKAISYLEGAGLRIVASKMVLMSSNMAEEFYRQHKGKPFFPGLIEHVTSGPVIAQVLKGENAIETNRAVMGLKDPKEAAKNTIRGDLATSIDSNLIHGSDGPEAASREIGMFFLESEIFS